QLAPGPCIFGITLDPAQEYREALPFWFSHAIKTTVAKFLEALMSGIFFHPLGRHVERFAHSASFRDQIHDGVARRHVAWQLAHPCLSVLDGPLQVSGEAIKLGCGFPEKWLVAGLFQCPEGFFGFAPIAHASEKGNGKDQKFRRAAMLGKRLCACSQRALGPSPLFESFDPTDPCADGAWRRSEPADSARQPGEALFLVMIACQGLTISNRIVLVTSRETRRNAETEQGACTVAVVPAQVRENMPAVGRLRLPANHVVEQRACLVPSTRRKTQQVGVLRDIA